MYSKEFELNYRKYYIELYEKNEVKIYEFIDGEKKHLFGKQKPIIVRKLAEIIENDATNGIPSEVKKYVCAYQKDLNKSAIKNTRNLGRVLFDYLNLPTNHRS